MQSEWVSHQKFILELVDGTNVSLLQLLKNITFVIPIVLNQVEACISFI